MKIPEVLIDWRGYVSEISDDEFTAIVKEQSSDIEEAMVLSKSEIPAEELPYLCLGAFLRIWISAKAKNKATRIECELKIEFSKDTWTKEEIEDAEREAEEIYRVFNG